MGNAAQLLCVGLATVLFAGLMWRGFELIRRPGKRRFRLGTFSGIGLLFGAVFFLRLAVAVYAQGHSVPDTLDDLSRLHGARALDLLADSFVHTLQTFSMDEDYTLYLNAGGLFLSGWGLALYRLLTNITNVSAPVVGGAIILDLLCRIFPKLRYQLLEHSRERYVFTQLNERSLKLAQSIGEARPRSSLIFLCVDAQNNLRRQAEELRALCTEDKLAGWDCVSWPDRAAHAFSARRTVALHLLLIDDNPQVNLKMAARLADGNMKGLNKAARCGFQYSAIVFSDSREDMRLIDSVNEKLAKDASGAGLQVMTAVQDERHTVLRLLKERPLFLPLLSGAYERLDVCVVGSGALAEEAVCQCYWYGQLLSPETGKKLPLTLHIVSETGEDSERLEQRLRHRMPEAFDTEKEDCREAGAFRFYAAAPGEAAFDELFSRDLGEVSSFILCPGEENAIQQAAMTVQRLVGRREMRANRPAMVYCASQSVTLGKWLEEHCEAVREKLHSNCYVVAFGSLRERYSYGSVFRSDLLHYAAMINDTYEGEYSGWPADVIRLMRNHYRMNSSVAFAIHVSAKLFSAGLFSERDFPKITDEALERAAKAFENVKQDARRFGRIAYLEHMRWSAYARSCGYESVTVEEMECFQRADEYAPRSEELLLHNCLVPMGDGALFNRGGVSDAPESDQPEWDREVPDPAWDELDTVSWRQHRAALRFYERKGRPAAADAQPRKMLPGLYGDYKTYDAKLLKVISQNVVRYLHDEHRAHE